jgi:transposase-like protein
MVREPSTPSQWAAIASIAEKLGCTTETLRRWLMRQAEAGYRPSVWPDHRRAPAIEKA